MENKLSKNKSILLDVIGFLLFSFGVAAIANSLFLKNVSQIFWGCYLGLLIMGIGIIKRNSFLIMTQVYILTIPVILWNIDFFYWLIFNQPLWGTTDYFFLERTLTLSKIISLQHLFAVPLAILSTYLIGLKRKDAWKWSFIQIFLVYMAVSLLTASEENINCVFDPCVNVAMGGISYRLAWFIIFFGMTFVTSILTNKVLLNK